MKHHQKHRTFADFPNVAAAKRYLQELQGKVSDMQRKLDHAKFKAKAYKQFSSPDWLHRLGTALDCHKQEARALEEEIVAAERRLRRMSADFYWHFFNEAKRELPESVFERLEAVAHSLID